MLVKTVWVFPVTTISWTTRWLYISRIPWLRTNSTKEGVRTHCSRTFFIIISLHEHTTLVIPVLLQSKDNFLESQFFRHYLLLIHKVSYDSGYKKNRVSAPKSFDLGASETRFHPNLLLHFICCTQLFAERKRHLLTLLYLAFTIPSSLEKRHKPFFLVSIIAEIGKLVK